MKLADDLISRYEQRVSPSTLRVGISFWDIYRKLIEPDYGIKINLEADFSHEPNGNEILGQYEFGSRVASVSKSLSYPRQNPRFMFTLIHEVCGHGVLQQGWVDNNLKSPQLVCTDTDVELSLLNVSQWERQANIFAASVGAPVKYVERYAIENLGLCRPIRWLGPREYSIGKSRNEQRVYCGSLDDLCRRIAKRVQCRFSFLSAEAIGYQVRASRIVDNIEHSERATMRDPVQDAGGLSLHRTALTLQRIA